MRSKDLSVILALVVFALLGWSTTASGAPPEAIDLNRASAQQLVRLPGVGPKRALDIVEFRQRHGFRRPTDLLRIKGIGRRLYFRIKPHITVGPRVELSTATAQGG